MLEKDCKRINRKLSSYLDNEVSARERMAIETHIKACYDCAAEKEALQKLTTLFLRIPDIIPAEDSEKLFWEKVNQKRRRRFVERIRSFITQWDFIPILYPATALLFLGLTIGIGASKIYTTSLHQGTLHPAATQYLALNRMDTIPYNSFTGVYISGGNREHNTNEDER